MEYNRNISIPRKHHYVPQCYLKQFGNSQKQFWRRSKVTKKASPCTSAQVGYETDYFKIRSEETLLLNDLHDFNHVEKFSFAKQENNYLATLKKVIRLHGKQVISRSECQLFIETLITIKRRNPQSREALINSFIQSHNVSEALPAYKEYLLQEAAKSNVTLEEGVDERIEEYIRDKGANPDHQHDMYLSGFFNKEDFTVISNITNQLLNLKLYVLHSSANTQFITSDNPGFTKFQNRIVSMGGFGGDFEFFFPLTPTTCLYINSFQTESIEFSDKEIISLILPDYVVGQINSLTKFIASRKLFGNNKNVLENV